MARGRWHGTCAGKASGRPQAHPAADGEDGPGADLPAAADDGAEPRAPDFPYLLRDLVIERPNQVWCADITYLPMRRGFLYLVAVMDWATRKVLAWRVSNTMDVEFCLEAWRRRWPGSAGRRSSIRDQGSQFTSPRFSGRAAAGGIRISMDGRGRWMDNVFIERLWRSLKYECVYLHAFETGSELRAGLSKWIGYYNAGRPHSALAGRTPNRPMRRTA